MKKPTICPTCGGKLEGRCNYVYECEDCGNEYSLELLKEMERSK